MTDRQTLEAEWDRLLKAELRKTKNIILALSHLRTQHRALWQALNGPREPKPADQQPER